MRGRAAVDPTGLYVRFEFDEGATIDDWHEAKDVMLRLSRETGIRRALVDLRRQKTSGQPIDLFEFGASLPERMACAVLADLGRDDYKFVETVALNRGRPVSLFSARDEDAAIEWLQADAELDKRKG